jgi:hypothetical protein
VDVSRTLTALYFGFLVSFTRSSFFIESFLQASAWSCSGKREKELRGEEIKANADKLMLVHKSSNKYADEQLLGQL